MEGEVKVDWEEKKEGWEKVGGKRGGRDGKNKKVETGNEKILKE